MLERQKTDLYASLVSLLYNTLRFLNYSPGSVQNWQKYEVFVSSALVAK